MGLQFSKTHWFSFKNSCVSVCETQPSEGEKKLLLFIHGRFGQAEVWHLLVPLLANQFRCFTVDLPGFGHSFTIQQRPFSLVEHASLINELIYQFCPPNEKVILIGHDIGGGIAELCTWNLPDKIEALILINSTCLTQSLSKIRTGLAGYMARRELKTILSQSKKMIPQIKNHFYSPFKNRIKKNSFLNSLRALDDSWPWHYEQLHWKSWMEKMKQPVLLLWGGKDTLNPPNLASHFIQKLPTAYFHLNEDLGHWPCLEDPDWVALKVQEFIFKLNAAKKLTHVF